MTRWRKSSRSGGNDGAACVEIAFAQQVAVRDSKNPEPRLSFSAERFRDFLSHVGQ